MAKYSQKRWVSAPLTQDKDLREFASSIQDNLSDLWNYAHDHTAIGADVTVADGDRVVVSDSEGVIESSTITTDELDTLSGVTSNIQSQIDAKQPIGSYITALTGDVAATGPGSAASTLATVNSNVGSFTSANITVNAKGLITAAANGAADTGITQLTGDVTAGPGNGSQAATLVIATFVSSHIVTRETPSGLVNSSNTVYTLASTPIAGTEHVHLNGILMASGGTDYTISSATITFVTAPATGDILRVSYIK